MVLQLNWLIFVFFFYFYIISLLYLLHVNSFFYIFLCFYPAFNDKEYLKYCLKKIEEVVSKYKLSLNDKTKIINVSKEGIDFLGFRFYVLNNKVVMKVRRDTKKKFKRKMGAIKKGKIDDATALQIINSYKGHLKWGNCHNLLKKINEDF